MGTSTLRCPSSSRCTVLHGVLEPYLAQNVPGFMPLDGGIAAMWTMSEHLMLSELPPPAASQSALPLAAHVREGMVGPPACACSHSKHFLILGCLCDAFDAKDCPCLCSGTESPSAEVMGHAVSESTVIWY